MAVIIKKTDLPTALRTHELVDVMIAGANAKATRVAPCLTGDAPTDPDALALYEARHAEAKLVLIGAVQRWAEAGSGAITQQSTGPFAMSVDTRQRGGFNLWPSEITQLQDICKPAPQPKKAFGVDTIGILSAGHAETCSLNLGATFCSCGADIAGEPIFGTAD